jgi:hypothetical protein
MRRALTTACPGRLTGSRGIAPGSLGRVSSVQRLELELLASPKHADHRRALRERHLQVSAQCALTPLITLWYGNERSIVVPLSVQCQTVTSPGHHAAKRPSDVQDILQ